MAKKVFKSPQAKLVKFFWQSRDKWREKCKQAKRELKLLKLRLTKLQTSRDRWKEKARQLQAELKERSRADDVAAKNESRRRHARISAA